MDLKTTNKITEIVRLKQILNKWKKITNANKKNNTSLLFDYNPNGGSRSIKFLKKTLSFTETSLMSNSSFSSHDVVPKGYVAVCVGKELKRFVIPMEYLGHQAFVILLRKAEEEFGFQQEGVLKIPCEVSIFEKILEMMGHKRDSVFFLNDEFGFADQKDINYVMGCYSSPSHHHSPLYT